MQRALPELHAVGHVPSVPLMGVAKAVAVWQDAATVSDPNPYRPLLGLCPAWYTLRAMLAAKSKDLKTSMSAQERKGNPDLVCF